MTKQGGWPPSGFGQRLKELREARVLTAQQLADQAGCHQMTISKMERGVQEPAWPLVIALGKALGVEIGAFVVDKPAQAEEMPKKPARKAAGRPGGKRATSKAASGPGDKTKRSKGR